MSFLIVWPFSFALSQKPTHLMFTQKDPEKSEAHNAESRSRAGAGCSRARPCRQEGHLYCRVDGRFQERARIHCLEKRHAVGESEGSLRRAEERQFLKHQEVGRNIKQPLWSISGWGRSPKTHMENSFCL